MESVFKYTDYRKFLRDFYQERKSAVPSFTHRFIAQKVGFKSGGHFSLILDGKANISITFIERIARFIGLSKKEAGYFQNMVLFNQAKRHDDKKRYFEHMMSYTDAVVRIVDAAQYEFYDKWYYSALRELCALYPLSDNSDFAQIGRMLEPPITEAQARRAFALLKRLELIHVDETGFYHPKDRHISTGYDASSLSINTFILNALDLAKQSIDRFPREERNLSWLSLSVSEEGYASIVEELRQTRRRIMTIVENDKKTDRVYLLNYQLIPLSKRLPKTGGKP
jgi:uncharacterized protein (TIGR02147 family)